MSETSMRMTFDSDELEVLREVSKRQGYVLNTSKLRGEGNVKALLRAIASGTLQLVEPSEGVIYFVRRESDQAVKIGTTSNLGGRLNTLKTEHGEIELLGTIWGSRPQEQLIHGSLADFRLEGEWFVMPPEVEQAIVKYTHLPKDIPQVRMIRISSDTHQMLRTLSFMTNASMTATVNKIVNEHIESNMTDEEQGTMWQLMSMQVTQARKD